MRRLYASARARGPGLAWVGFAHRGAYLVLDVMQQFTFPVTVRDGRQAEAGLAWLAGRGVACRARE